METCGTVADMNVKALTSAALVSLLPSDQRRVAVPDPGRLIALGARSAIAVPDPGRAASRPARAGIAVPDPGRSSDVTD